MTLDRLFYVLLRACVVGLVAAFFAPPMFAQVRGLSYTLSPVVEQIYFGNNAGLDDGQFYGGKLGLGFGRFVELEGLYLLNNNFANDFGDLTGLTDATLDKLEELERTDIALRRYGGNIKINIPAPSVLPFVTAGAGALSFEPEHLNRTRTIYLALGGGVQFSVAGRYALTVAAQRFGYRYNLGATFFDDLDLAQADLSDDSFNHTQVYNWALQAGLRIYVGGRAPGEETELDAALREQFSGGLRGLSLRVEPFGAQINFDEDLGFKTDQRFAGLFAGINLGPFLGVRGFYWRGIESGLFDFDRLQAYGGELRFELATGQSLSPYLTVGGGYLDVLSGYSSTTSGDEPPVVRAASPKDEPFIIAGGGAILPLNESLSLNVGARSVLVTREGADNVTAPSDVVSSWMFSAGLNFGFGARRGGAGSVIRSEIADSEAARDREEEVVRQDLAAAEARLDSLAALIQRMAAGDEQAMQEAQALTARRDTLRVTRDTLGSPEVARREDRMVTLPLPEQGEIYIRFGEPGGVSIESIIGDDVSSDEIANLAATRQSLTAEQIEQIVSQTVREQLRTSGQQPAADLDIAQIERRIQDRLDDLEDRMQSRLDRTLTELQQSERPARVIIEDRDGVTREGQDVYAVDVRQPSRRDLYPFIAFLSGEPNLGFIGVRLDPGAPFFGPVELQPEIGIGIGADTYAYHLNLDAVYTTGIVARAISGLRPYLGLGVGMLGFNEKPEDAPGVQFTVNVRLGSEFALRWGTFFIEYGTFDFFEYHRVATGYRVRL